MKIPRDKLLHAGVGALVACVFMIPPLLARSPDLITLLLGTFGSFVAGVTKEHYDSLHPEKHTEDFNDGFATLVGGYIATFLALMVKSAVT